LLTFLVERGLSQRAACRFLNLNRSTFQYQARGDNNADLRERLHAFARKRRRRGYRKAWNYLRRDGIQASKNRVHRLWKQEHLQVRKRPGKKHKPSTVSEGLPLVALHPDHHPRERGYPVGGLPLRRDGERNETQDPDGRG
jgi:hypothetical protein